MPRRSSPIIAAAIAGLVAIGSVNASAQNQRARPNIDPTACQFFTLDEIKTSMGRKDFSQGRPKQVETGSSQCFYSGARGSFTVTINSQNPKKDFDAFKKLLTDQGEKLEPVAGLGDDAYFWGDRITVRVGGKSLVMWIGEQGDAAKIRAGLQSLAKLGVGRLR